MAGPPPPYESVMQDDSRDSPFFLPATTVQQQQNHLATSRMSVARAEPVEKEFDVSVSDPIKQGDGVAAYVAFKVRTRTSHPRYKSSSEVVRRFRDFSSLHDRLSDKNKGVIIPPMPEKSTMQKFTMSAEFIESRRRALQVFINKVCCHPALKEAHELKMFLEANEEEWMLETARAQAETNANKAPAATTWFKGLQQGAQSLLQVAGQRPDDSGEDAEYIRVRDYINQLEAHLVEAHRQAGRLVKKETEVAGALAEFGVAAEHLGKFDDGAAMRFAFDSLSSKAGSVATLSKTRAEALANSFEAPLKEAARSIRSVQAAMADRTAALTAYTQAKSDVDTRKLNLARLRGRPGLQESKISEAERELHEADVRVRTTKVAYEQIAARMTEELNRFQKERAAEMTTVLREFALAQAQQAADTAWAWQTFVNELQAQAAGA